MVNSIFRKAMPSAVILLGIIALWAIPVMATMLLSISTTITVTETFGMKTWNSNSTGWATMPSDGNTANSRQTAMLNTEWDPVFYLVSNAGPRPLGSKITIIPTNNVSLNHLGIWYHDGSNTIGCWEGDDFVLYTLLPQYSNEIIKVDYIPIDAPAGNMTMTHQTKWERTEPFNITQKCLSGAQGWDPVNDGFMTEEDFTCKNYYLIWERDGTIPEKWDNKTAQSQYNMTYCCEEWWQQQTFGGYEMILQKLGGADGYGCIEVN